VGSLYVSIAVWIGVELHSLQCCELWCRLRPSLQYRRYRLSCTACAPKRTACGVVLHVMIVMPTTEGRSVIVLVLDFYRVVARAAFTACARHGGAGSVHAHARTTFPSDSGRGRTARHANDRMQGRCAPSHALSVVVRSVVVMGLARRV
jgi:hypothetical protein